MITRVATSLLGLLALFGPAASASAQTSKPNIIVIFADDLGYADVGCFGAKGFKTPHLDRMAKEGIRLTSFYTACSVCSGSRAALMTGRHYQRVGVPAVMYPSNRGLNPNEITIAALLRKLGYSCGIIGKWHLGNIPAYLPTKHGFQTYYGIPYSNDMTIDPVSAKFAKDVVFRDGKTEAIAKRASLAASTCWHSATHMVSLRPGWGTGPTQGLDALPTASPSGCSTPTPRRPNGLFLRAALGRDSPGAAILAPPSERGNFRCKGPVEIGVGQNKDDVGLWIGTGHRERRVQHHGQGISPHRAVLAEVTAGELFVVYYICELPFMNRSFADNGVQSTRC